MTFPMTILLWTFLSYMFFKKKEISTTKKILNIIFIVVLSFFTRFFLLITGLDEIFEGNIGEYIFYIFYYSMPLILCKLLWGAKNSMTKQNSN